MTLAAPSDCFKCEQTARRYVDHYEYLRCTPVLRSDCPKCVQRYECPRNYLVNSELDNSGSAKILTRSQRYFFSSVSFNSFFKFSSLVCHVANETYKVGQVIDYHKHFCNLCSCFDEATLLAVVPPEEGSSGSRSSPTSFPKVIARPRCSRFPCSRSSFPTESSKHCFQETDGDSCCPKVTCVSDDLLKSGEQIFGIFMIKLINLFFQKWFLIRNIISRLPLCLQSRVSTRDANMRMEKRSKSTRAHFVLVRLNFDRTI